MRDRNELLNYISLKEYSRAIEVGCYAGKFSGEIMRRTSIPIFYCIDAFDFRAMSNPDESAYKIFFRELSSYIIDRRLSVVPAESPQVARLFRKESIDFIYLDAGHTYNDVRCDLNAWWPVLRFGGILAGHDYKNVGRKKQVKKAVDEFFEESIKKVNVTGEKCPSFWVVK